MNFYDPQNVNNPSKEILAASGLYTEHFASVDGNPYADDIPNSFFPNTNVKTTTTKAPEDQETLINALFSSDLSSGNYFIDDMQIFNNYRHYSRGLQFNPQSFLEQSIVTFNIYNLDKR